MEVSRQAFGTAPFSRSQCILTSSTIHAFTLPRVRLISSWVTSRANAAAPSAACEPPWAAGNAAAMSRTRLVRSDGTTLAISLPGATVLAGNTIVTARSSRGSVMLSTWAAITFAIRDVVANAANFTHSMVGVWNSARRATAAVSLSSASLELARCLRSQQLSLANNRHRWKRSERQRQESIAHSRKRCS